MTAGLFVPVEILVMEKVKNGGTMVIYTLPSCLITGLNRDQELVEAVGALDRKLEVLVRDILAWCEESHLPLPHPWHRTQPIREAKTLLRFSTSDIARKGLFLKLSSGINQPFKVILLTLCTTDRCFYLYPMSGSFPLLSPKFHCLLIGIHMPSAFTCYLWDFIELHRCSAQCSVAGKTR